MCGIIGQIKRAAIDSRKFDESVSMLARRGPENQSIAYYENKDVVIGLGHTRLKIIDLSDKSNQPYEEGNTIIVFNGEIYNYKEIRNSLKKRGVEFATKSDTEVILKAYLNYGLEVALEKIRGMFAFCILDLEKKQAVLVRDRIGIKPLYYYKNGNEIIFASELKAIQKLASKDLTIRKTSVADYYYHRYIPEPNTVFEEVCALNPGKYLTINLENDLEMDMKTYWCLEYENKYDNEKEVVAKVEELLHESVKMHLLSDVPISFALSGGLDSSLLIAISKDYTKNLVGYTVKREDNDIDAFYASKVAKHLGIEQREIDFNAITTLLESEDIYEYYDQPIACSSIFPTFLLFKEISKEFKVTISGDGGDELFGGYEWYLRFMNLHYLKRFKLTSIKYSSARNIKNLFLDFRKYKSNDEMLVYKRIMLDRFEKTEIEDIINSFVYVEKEDLIKNYASSLENIKDLMYVDFHTFLRYNLQRSDFSSMAHSVENRVPMLDHKLIEFAFSIDDSLIMKGGELKNVLKKVATKYLPKELVYRKKRGFSAPIINFLPVADEKEYMKYIYRKWEKYYGSNSLLHKC